MAFNAFDDEGYLCDEAEDIRTTIRQRFPTTFALCMELNRLAHRVRNSIELDYDNVLHIILVCLLQRILEGFQSTVILMCGYEEQIEKLFQSVRHFREA